jgi:hypothetical protein
MTDFTPEEVDRVARLVGVIVPADPHREDMSEIGHTLHDASYDFVIAVLRAVETVLADCSAA